MASQRQRAQPKAAKGKARGAVARRTDHGNVAQKLKLYHQKRHFDRTPEPSFAGTSPKPAQGVQFVVQKHAARSLHYDFRLELDGVLLSWSVPKGPSLKPGLRRLAVRTEDHPLDYANFEGVIPKGEYGGGTVIVWDRGSWIPEGDPQQGLKSGRLTFRLQGEKLQGRFHLVRTRLDEGKRENWLLFKGHDTAESHDADDADADIVDERPESAISGRSIEEVTKLPGRIWHSKAVTEAKKKLAVESAPKRKGARSKNEPVPAAAAQADTLALVKRLPMPFALTSLDKVLYPEQNLRKAELIAYYVAVASFMLPHVEDRPLTLVRCPNGQNAKCFYQKHMHEGVPEVVLRVPIREEGSKQSSIYMAVQDLPGLIALAQMGVLEIHTWGCHRAHIEHPDKLVFDIDPDDGLHWDRCVEAAMELRERLSDVGIESFVQTTGGKGLHVVAPVTRRLTWDQHKNFALAIADSMAAEHPKLYVTNMRKALRKGKIFLDYLRNGRTATAIAPYSTRARSGATVAAPITWDELAEGVKPSDFSVHTMVDRLSELDSDPWKKYGRLKQAITAEALRSVGIK
jgi:bifunctional non-homologous end joining protein LigD